VSLSGSASQLVPRSYDHPIFCLLWDESDGGTVFAQLAFSYVFAFVIIAWSSGITALR
jgi:hypothetical protein